MSQGFTKGTPIDTDPTLSLNSDIVVPSQKAVKTYVASQIGTPVTSLTTTGSSGSATLISNVLNVPTYTLAGLGGQPQLNGTGFVKATGTTISYDNSTYTPTSRTLTIDGTSYDLSADRSWTTGGNYSAYTMKANNTASTAAPANFTFKDLGDQALPTSPTWNGTAPSGTVNNRYRWFQIGNVVHYHFSFTYTTAGTGNTTLSFTHPSDMPVPVAFTGVPGAVAAPYFLYRALSYAAATLNTQPPIGWYGGLKVNSTGPTVYGWAFSGTSLSLTNWSVHGTYYT